MTKPQWLIDKENHKLEIHRDPDMCCDCLYFGAFVKKTKHKGKDWCEVHECDIHPGCFNTEYSICCDDFTNATV